MMLMMIIILINAGHAGADNDDDNDYDNDDADDDNDTDQCRSCRGCAVKFVTQHRKCWSCGAANFKTSSLLNDQVRLNRFCTTVLTLYKCKIR